MLAAVVVSISVRRSVNDAVTPAPGDIEAAGAVCR
jgi:hypothetical protein